MHDNVDISKELQETKQVCCSFFEDFVVLKHSSELVWRPRFWRQELGDISRQAD